MNVRFIGITGGSGVGKSTLCNALKKQYPDNLQLIQLDDYFKTRNEKPMVGELVNSDHPDALDFDKLNKDLLCLSNGKSVTINTRNAYLNPEFDKTKIKIPIIFEPKPIIIVEGFLLLHDERIRKLLDTSIFLEAEHAMRWARRHNYSNKNKEYEEKVIIPMHDKFIEPTKKYAKHIINVSNLNENQVLEQVESILDNLF